MSEPTASNSSNRPKLSEYTSIGTVLIAALALWFTSIKDSAQRDKDRNEFQARERARVEQRLDKRLDLGLALLNPLIHDANEIRRITGEIEMALNGTGANSSLIKQRSDSRRLLNEKLDQETYGKLLVVSDATWRAINDFKLAVDSYRTDASPEQRKKQYAQIVSTFDAMLAAIRREFIEPALG